MHVRAQDNKPQLKKPQRRKLPWMKDDEDAPAASGDVLLTAAAPVPQMAAAAAAAADAEAVAEEAAALEATEAAATAEVITAAPAAAAKAAAMAMAETGTKPTEAAKVVQARLLPVPSRAQTPTDDDPTAKLSAPQVQVELKKGETIMIDASLHLPAAYLHEAFSNRALGYRLTTLSCTTVASGSRARRCSRAMASGRTRPSRSRCAAAGACGACRPLSGPL